MPQLQQAVIAVEHLQQFQERLDDALNAPDRQRQGIVFSTDLPQEPLAEPSGLTRRPITWPINAHNMFYVLDAPPGTYVPLHAHSGDVFRYLISGELTINNTPVKAGTWFVVRKGTPYAVASQTGYKALVAYQDVCEVTGARGE